MRKHLCLKIIFAIIISFCCSFLIISTVHAQVWQWSVPVKNAKEGNGASRAFLWIPENCKQLKGVVVAQNNMEEQSILESTIFRADMSRLDFAEIWFSPSFDHLFRFSEGAGEVFDSMMRYLAYASGYVELKNVPVVPIGHSASASWPYYFAAWKPERTLCAISVSGQWPYFRSPVFAPDIWGNRNIDFVPCLETMGEYEAANSWSTEGLKERKEHPFIPLSMLACPAEGHFAATEKKIAYIAFYIKKAFQYRVIKNATATGPAVLKQINPMLSGWLVDKWRMNEKPHSASAPVEKFAGDTTDAFWFFDEEHAKKTEQYQSGFYNKKAALLGYIQNGKVIQQHNTHLQVQLKFLPKQDGITFTVKGTFLDTVPEESERPAMWTGKKAGSTIGHAKNSNKILINRIAGPFKKINDTTFRLSLERGLSSNPKDYSLVFAATHEGDEEYKPAVQQAEMRLPARNETGMGQQIIFPVIGDMKITPKAVLLRARSSAGLPVHYFIKAGPAIIKDNRLIITPIPLRSKFPVKVTVVAWQYGRTMEPKLQTAEPVERSFFIYR